MNVTVRDLSYDVVEERLIYMVDQVKEPLTVECVDRVIPLFVDLRDKGHEPRVVLHHSVDCVDLQLNYVGNICRPDSLGVEEILPPTQDVLDVSH